jgi:hypothetical protein
MDENNSEINFNWDSEINKINLFFAQNPRLVARKTTKKPILKKGEKLIKIPVIIPRNQTTLGFSETKPKDFIFKKKVENKKKDGKKIEQKQQKNDTRFYK